MPRDLFARGEQRGARSRRCSARFFRGAPSGKTSCASCSPAMSRPSSAQQRARLRRSAALLGAHDAGAGDRAADRGALRSRAGRRISGHQPAAGFDPAGAEAERARADRRRRRRAVDLFVSRRDRAQHPRLSRPFPPAGAMSSRWSRTTARRSRSSPRRTRSSGSPPSASPRTSGRSETSAERPQLVSVRDEADQARYVVETVLGKPRGRASRSRRRPCCSAPRTTAAPLEVELTRRNIPFVKFGGLKFLEAAHVKDVLALLRWAENPRDRVAGFRVVQLLPGIGPATAAKRARSHRRAGGPRRRRSANSSRRRRPPSIGRPSSSAVAAGAQRDRGLAGRARSGAPLVRAAPAAHPRRRGVARGRSPAACADRRDLSEPRALPDRADARSAGRHQRRGRRAAARRGLSDPFDHPLGQGAGVEVGVRPQHRRRLHARPTSPPARARRSKRSGGCSMWR